MKKRANTRPVLLTQGEPGTPQYIIIIYILIYITQGLFKTGFDMNSFLFTYIATIDTRISLE